MGRLPPEIWALTPLETADLIQGWNEAQAAASGEVDPPTMDAFEELKARYG